MLRVVVGLLVLSIIGCGKNDAVRPTGFGYVPPPVAPAPNAPYPGGYGPSFNPSLPSGYPRQYTPFLPVDHYFRQNQQMQVYWQQLWFQWQQYAAVRNYSVYSFAPFWNEFCPQVWAGSPMMQVHDYYNTNFYFWMNSGYQFPSQMDPYSYWAPYSGYSAYTPCEGYCY